VRDTSTRYSARRSSPPRRTGGRRSSTPARSRCCSVSSTTSSGRREERGEAGGDEGGRELGAVAVHRDPLRRGRPLRRVRDVVRPRTRDERLARDLLPREAFGQGRHRDRRVVRGDVRSPPGSSGRSAGTSATWSRATKQDILPVFEGEYRNQWTFAALSFVVLSMFGMTLAGLTGNIYVAVVAGFPRRHRLRVLRGRDLRASARDVPGQPGSVAGSSAGSERSEASSTRSRSPPRSSRTSTSATRSSARR